jgi:Prealbumin-like fold domain
MGRLRNRARLALAVVILAAGAVGMWRTQAPVGAAAGSTTASVWLQTMDSCKQALGGAQYQLVGPGLDLRVTTPSHTKQQVGSPSTCPLQQGNCSSISTGCVQFSDLPPGTYRIHEIVTPKGDNSNPEGYAACNGGSACQSQEVDLTVSSSGSASATVTNVYPNGKVAVYPTASVHSGRSTYAGTASDPIVVHNFGLAPPGFNGARQCDGDGDADDHSTGTPSSECAYPEAKESSACKPFPWSCTLGLWPVPPGTTTSSPTTTSSGGSTTTSTSTSTSTSTTTDTSSTSCRTDTFTGTVRKNSSTSQTVTTSATAALTVTVTWSPSSTVSVKVYGTGSNVLASTSQKGTSLTLQVPAVPAGSHRVQVKVKGASRVGFTLSVDHC